MAAASGAGYLVIDVEATCDDGLSVPRHEMEIVEIGAVLVDDVSLAPFAEFQTFVRPVRHPVLTTFCTRLTSITQGDVANAPTFPAALSALGAFVREHAPTSRPVFCSWGDYDRKQFEQDAAYHGVKLPFGANHLNLKKRFAEQSGETKKLGMHEALSRVGLPLLGTHHRGIDDARNIARLLPWVLAR
jgi:inhibitor of KinA sporulation pathway (predicted exonuclease)